MTDKSAQKSDKVRGKPFTGKNDPRRNDGGRPAGYAAYREKMRGHTDAAIQALVDDLQVPDKRAFAAKEILVQGWGRPPAAPEDRDAAARGVLSFLSRDDFFGAVAQVMGKRLPDVEEDPLAIPAKDE